MDLESRINHVVRIMNQAETELSAREVAKQYVDQATTSDALTTNTILKVMAHLGLVKKIMVCKQGRTPRYKYRGSGNNLIVVG